MAAIGLCCDRRITCLRVSPKGTEACRRTDDLRRDLSLQAFGHLSDDEQEKVLLGLTALRRAWALVPDVVA
jgi:DNA-binding MarR family transcriptional regulator